MAAKTKIFALQQAGPREHHGMRTVWGLSWTWGSRWTLSSVPEYQWWEKNDVCFKETCSEEWGSLSPERQRAKLFMRFVKIFFSFSFKDQTLKSPLPTHSVCKILVSVLGFFPYSLAEKFSRWFVKGISWTGRQGKGLPGPIRPAS